MQKNIINALAASASFISLLCSMGVCVICLFLVTMLAMQDSMAFEVKLSKPYIEIASYAGNQEFIPYTSLGVGLEANKSINKINDIGIKSRVDALAAGVFADQSFLFWKGNLGMLELGSTPGLAYRMQSGLELLSSFPSFFLPMGPEFASDQFLFAPYLQSEYLNLIESDARGVYKTTRQKNKISYITSDLNNLKLGFAYTFPLDTVGSLLPQKSKSALGRVVQYGFLYTQKMDDVSLRASMILELSRFGKLDEMFAYDAGINVGWRGMLYAISFGKWYQQPANRDSMYFGVGAEYAIGPMQVGVKFFRSNRVIRGDKDNAFSQLALSCRYRVLKQLWLQLGVSSFVYAKPYQDSYYKNNLGLTFGVKLIF